MQMLIQLSTLLLFTSFFNEDTTHIFAECLSIFFGVLFSCSISAGCDYVKEKQKLMIMDEINNQKVIVTRGARGNSTSIAIRDLVVGDIVDIKQGDRVPADCILVEEMGIKVDQSDYFKELKNPVKLG
jgi:magnesium-transporting ATPase (P-type)